jgi:hypothetical protein
MSSATLRDIIERLPSERDAIQKLGDLIEDSGEDDAFTAESLYDQVGASSMRVLSRILFEMTDCGLVDSFMTVESPGGAGLGPYYSISEIPRVLPDPYSPGDRKIRVHPSDIRVHYRRHSGK